jgi:hypothetical protein
MTRWLTGCSAAIALFLFSPLVFAQTTGTSYRYVTASTSSFATNPTDWVVLSGATGKAIHILGVQVCGSANAPGATINVALVRRSTADTGGGSPATVAAVNLSGTTQTPLSQTLIYTSNPTLGTAQGNVDMKPLNLGPPTGAAGCAYMLDPTTGEGPTILIGPNQQLAINLGGAAMPAGVALTATIKVTEK